LKISHSNVNLPNKSKICCNDALSNFWLES